MRNTIMQRLRKDIDDARNRGGMSTGDDKIWLRAADVERVLLMADAYTAIREQIGECYVETFPNLACPTDPLTTVDRMAAAIITLRKVLDETATDLEDEVYNRHQPDHAIRPDEQRKFDRDMAVVIRARALLSQQDGAIRDYWSVPLTPIEIAGAVEEAGFRVCTFGPGCVEAVHSDPRATLRASLDSTPGLWRYVVRLPPHRIPPTPQDLEQLWAMKKSPTQSAEGLAQWLRLLIAMYQKPTIKEEEKVLS